jgi:hypothetical protein
LSTYVILSISRDLANFVTHARKSRSHRVYPPREAIPPANHRYGSCHSTPRAHSERRRSPRGPLLCPHAACLCASSGTHLRTAAKQARELKRAEHAHPAAHAAHSAHDRARSCRKQRTGATLSAPCPTPSMPLRRPCGATLSTATNSRPSVGRSVRRMRGGKRLADGFARAHKVGEQTSDARERAAHLLRVRVAPLVRMKALSKAVQVVWSSKQTCTSQQRLHIAKRRESAQE